MAQIESTGIVGSPVPNGLMAIMMADDIVPGSTPSYQLCKEIYCRHPLGAKMVETPIKIAQSQKRIITIDNSPEQEVRQAFLDEWEAIKADYYIRGLMYTARMYGVGSIAVVPVDGDSEEPLDLASLSKGPIYFNILDSLNTAGSLVLDQDPNSPLFQKAGAITSNGKKYHGSRTLVMFNEQPIYIEYTSSAFGFSGRSVFQRALFPLKSFIQSMVTDDMVTRKAGLLIAMLRQAGSIVNKLMQAAAGIKRNLLREGVTNNVLSIELDEKVESINLQNTDTAMTTARNNIIKNIATAADMPAKLLENESFVEGFGEGVEDTKAIVRYVQGVRAEMHPAYAFMDRICQHRAWSPEFIAGMREAYPEMFEGKTDAAVFYEWQKGFKAEWPNLLEESDGELSKLEKVKLEGLVSVYEILSASADPDNKARLAEWVQDNANEFKKLFRVGLNMDIDALREYVPPVPQMGGEDEAEGTKPPAPLRAVK